MRPTALALASLAFALLVAPTSRAAAGTSYGIASGSINLPFGGNGNGIAGSFVRFGGQTVFDFEGHFHELDQPDPQHRTGIVHGFLYASGSTEPDYVVYGHWTLEIATGDGTFYAPIYEPEHVLEIASGRIGGIFHEPPGDPTPALGTYQAQWGLSW